MKISFILPPNGDHPIGGFKIIFQYANQLVTRGNEVTLYFLNNLYPERVSKIHAIGSKIKRKFKEEDYYSRITWFSFDKKVNIRFNVSFQRELKSADVIVATAVQTAKWVSKINNKYGRKFYFIQGYETWAYPKSEVDATFKLPLTKIVIARWLRDMVKNHTKEPVYVIPNFVDGIYKEERTTLNRKNVISMLYHESPQKNSGFGLEVLRGVKVKIPDLKVKLFGVFEKPDNLDDFMDYYKNPKQLVLKNEIYGKSKIYVLPSLSEGWGLTGMEAMSSGAVLISSRIEGVMEYAQNNKNAILVTANDKQKFIKAIVTLLTDENMRLKIVKNAFENVKKYDIKKSTEMLMNIFMDDRETCKKG